MKWTIIFQLIKIISNRICNSDISKLLDEILQVCSESENLYSKRLKLVESALIALAKAKVSISHANDIVNRIVIDFPNYPKLHLIKLVEFCLASIRHNDDDFRRYTGINFICKVNKAIQETYIYLVKYLLVGRICCLFFWKYWRKKNILIT